MGQPKRKSKLLDSQFSRTKTKTMRIWSPLPAIKSLPQDLLIEVLAKVGASSYTDLLNAKLATKAFLEASNDGHIFRHVSLRSFQKVPWKTSPHFSRFMEACNNNGNPEALYRKGMLEFFSLRKEASGLANLKASAEKGHVEASYVYGVVLCLSSSGLEEEGVEFLKKCEVKLGDKMVECRRRIKSFIREIWINNDNVFNLEEDYVCDLESCNGEIGNENERRKGWDWNDEEDSYGEYMCEICKWNGEVLRFCNMLRTGSYN